MGITHVSIVDSPIDEVFAWHERPGAFTRLAPPWQPARIVKESTSLENGVAILRLPAGLTWVSRHDPAGYQPPHRFTDVSTFQGLSSIPVALTARWVHDHDFEEVEGNRTRVIDRVKTPIGSRALRPMFRYRHRQLAEDLMSHKWASDKGVEPSTIAVTGASGLVGSALCAFLTTGGHRVIRLVRRPVKTADERRWNPLDPAPDLLDGVDAVVHLAGESIAGRFTAHHKRAVMDSRIEPTRLLSRLAIDAGIKTFVVASAIGIYGAKRGDEQFSETSSAGEDFLAGVVSEWEAASAQAQAAGVRVVKVRTGIVQSARGGSLQVYRPLFSLGVGGPIAGGQQWVSWIDIDDLVDVYHRALFDPKLSGPVNAVAPLPVRNADYARILGRVLRRPAILPVPALAPRAVLGSEGSKDLVEVSQFVIPAALDAVGFEFRRPDLESSLRHQLGRLLPPTGTELSQNTKPPQKAKTAQAGKNKGEEPHHD